MCFPHHVPLHGHLCAYTADTSIAPEREEQQQGAERLWLNPKFPHAWIHTAPGFVQK